MAKPESISNAFNKASFGKEPESVQPRNDGGGGSGGSAPVVRKIAPKMGP